MSKKSRLCVARNCLIFWTLFIGIGAVAGAMAMLIDPSGKSVGMDKMLPYFKKLPFSDVLFTNLTFSGIALLIVNGITNLISAFLLFKKKTAGIIAGGIFGITLMLWICIQFYMFPFNFMSTAYFIFGLCQAVTGYVAWVGFKQGQFSFNESDYNFIGVNSQNLVVFFSRSGYCKKIAYEQANLSGADILEVKTTEKISGTSGFWWCGRFGLTRMSMPIKEIDVDLSKCNQVTIVSPIWVFSLCAPIREFCKKAKGKIKNVNYVLVHFTNGKYQKVAKLMDELLSAEHTSLKNIRCRMGKFKEL